MRKVLLIGWGREGLVLASSCFFLLVLAPLLSQQGTSRLVQIREKGGDNSNKRCFGTKPKLFWESGDFSGNRDTWKFFRETRDNSGTLQNKIGASTEILFHVSQKFGRMIQISGTTSVKT